MGIGGGGSVELEYDDAPFNRGRGGGMFTDWFGYDAVCAFGIGARACMLPPNAATVALGGGSGGGKLNWVRCMAGTGRVGSAGGGGNPDPADDAAWFECADADDGVCTD